MLDFDDHVSEECGVFGIWGPGEDHVAQTIYQGLLALQHRGQESAGIVDLSVISVPTKQWDW